MVVLGASLSGSAARGRRDGGWRTRVRDRAFLELGQPCARLRGSRAGAVVQPRQAGAALGPHHRYCSPERIRAGPARAEECQSGLSTRVASGERPAAALASPWQNAVGSHQRCTTNEQRTVHSINQGNGIDLTLSTPSRYHQTAWWAASQQLLRNQSCPHREQQRVRTNGHPPASTRLSNEPPRARLHAPHARCGF